MTEELRRRVASPMFFQRPTYWKTATLGHCELEPDSDLAARSSYLGQRFVMLQDLNNLRLVGGNARPLTPAERAALLDAMGGQKSMTFGAIRKLLKPLWQADGTDLKSKFNFEEDKRKTLPGNAMEADLRAVFGDAWATFPARDRLRHALDDYLRRIHYCRATDGGKGDRIEIRRPVEDDMMMASAFFVDTGGRHAHAAEAEHDIDRRRDGGAVAEIDEINRRARFRRGAHVVAPRWAGQNRRHRGRRHQGLEGQICMVVPMVSHPFQIAKRFPR